MILQALITYSLQDFFRSHKYFPPISTYIIFIFVFYTYTPNPVIDSYAVTAVVLYIISSWLCISLLSLDPPVQKQVMILTIESSTRYYLSKLVSVWLIAIALTLYAFFYPIIFNMFSEPISFTTGSVSLINHILSATLGVCVASLFSSGLMKSLINSYGGLAFTLTLSIAAQGIYTVLPSPFKQIVWAIPPAMTTQSPLRNWSGETFIGLPLFPFVWLVIYSCLILLLFLKLSKR